MNILETRLAEARKKKLAAEVRRNGIAIVRENKMHVGGSQAASQVEKPVEFDLGKFSAGFADDIEREPRTTVLAMMKAKKLDEEYSFKVAPGEADNYIQAMRQVLSRTRKKAKQRKLPLEEFKLLRVAVEETSTHDLVTLVRTQTLDAHQQSVYDDLLEAFSAVKKEEK